MSAGITVKRYQKNRKKSVKIRNIRSIRGLTILSKPI